MKIFILNDPVVQELRRSHPVLKGRKLIGSGQFSGVFEGDTPDTVLKLSIDEASYLFHTDNFLKPSSKHFTKLIRDYGSVGKFVTSKNVTRTLVSNPVELNVPMYLYEIERLEKIKQKTVNSTLSRRLTTEWRNLDARSQVPNVANRARDVAFKLRDNAWLLNEHPTVLDAVDEIADFIFYHCDSFVDLHGANMMQRKDGTFVFSDPVGDTRIYNSHYTFKSVTHLTTTNVRKIQSELKASEFMPKSMSHH